MNTNSIQQEILLIRGTTFSSREFIEKDKFNDSPEQSEIENLEEACANGLLQEALPEIFELTGNTVKIFLWDFKEAESFIEFNFSEEPEEKDCYFSIDPYVFIFTKSAN